MNLPDEFRVNHRAASESLLVAASIDSNLGKICYELDKATYFEDQAMKHIATPRQRALAMGLMHAIDLMRAVANAELQSHTA